MESTINNHLEQGDQVDSNLARALDFEDKRIVRDDSGRVIILERIRENFNKLNNGNPDLNAEEFISMYKSLFRIVNDADLENTLADAIRFIQESPNRVQILVNRNNKSRLNLGTRIFEASKSNDKASLIVDINLIDPNLPVLLIDDCAYTGTQLQSQLVNLRGRNVKEVYLFLAGVSEAATNKLMKYENVKLKGSLKLIPKIQDMIPDKFLPIFMRMFFGLNFVNSNQAREYLDSRNMSYYTTVTTRKIPDSLSLSKRLTTLEGINLFTSNAQKGSY